MLEAVSDTETALRDHHADITRLQEQVAAAFDAAGTDLDTARDSLAAACALPTRPRCDGCHTRKAAAIQAAEQAVADAEQRITICAAAAEILDPLTSRLHHALAYLRRVPEDLGEAYALVYAFIRRGGKMPAYGRWITGQDLASRPPESVPMSGEAR